MSLLLCSFSLPLCLLLLIFPLLLMGKWANCQVCNKNLARWEFQSLCRKFRDFNPNRDVLSHQPLNLEQRSFLMYHYLNPATQEKGLCGKHLRELACISKDTLARLTREAKKPPNFAPPIFDPLPKKRGPSGLSTAVIWTITRWLKEVSAPDPRITNQMVIFANLPSKRQVFQRFSQEHPQGSPFHVCQKTFCGVWIEHCPEIKVVYSFPLCSSSL